MAVLPSPRRPARRPQRSEHDTANPRTTPNHATPARRARPGQVTVTGVRPATERPRPCPADRCRTTTSDERGRSHLTGAGPAAGPGRVPGGHPAQGRESPRPWRSDPRRPAGHPGRGRRRRSPRLPPFDPAARHPSGQGPPAQRRAGGGHRRRPLRPEPAQRGPAHPRDHLSAAATPRPRSAQSFPAGRTVPVPCRPRLPCPVSRPVPGRPPRWSRWPAAATAPTTSRPVRSRSRRCTPPPVARTGAGGAHSDPARTARRTRRGTALHTGDRRAQHRRPDPARQAGSRPIPSHVAGRGPAVNRAFGKDLSGCPPPLEAVRPPGAGSTHARRTARAPQASRLRSAIARCRPRSAAAGDRPGRPPAPSGCPSPTRRAACAGSAIRSAPLPRVRPTRIRPPTPARPPHRWPHSTPGASRRRSPARPVRPRCRPPTPPFDQVQGEAGRVPDIDRPDAPPGRGRSRHPAAPADPAQPPWQPPRVPPWPRHHVRPDDQCPISELPTDRRLTSDLQRAVGVRVPAPRPRIRSGEEPRKPHLVRRAVADQRRVTPTAAPMAGPEIRHP